MSGNNGVIRIGHKGKKKFAFGDGPVFEVDVVVAFQHWIQVDESFRPEEDAQGGRPIPLDRTPEYHQAAVDFAQECVAEADPRAIVVTTAEALDFIARLREQYDELAVFFRPRSSEERESPGTSEAPLARFSAEES